MKCNRLHLASLLIVSIIFAGRQNNLHQTHHFARMMNQIANVQNFSLLSLSADPFSCGKL